MKVTFIEEIETHRAWLETMSCPKCCELKYRLHHQTFPTTENSWWLECANCEFESPAAPSRELAIKAWKKSR